MTPSLLDLQAYHGIDIIKAREFVNIWSRQGKAEIDPPKPVNPACRSVMEIYPPLEDPAIGAPLNVYPVKFTTVKAKRISLGPL